MAGFGDVKSQSPQFDQEQAKLMVNNKNTINDINTTTQQLF